MIPSFFFYLQHYLSYTFTAFAFRVLGMKSLTSPRITKNVVLGVRVGLLNLIHDSILFSCIQDLIQMLVHKTKASCELIYRSWQDYGQS